jgi:hypothetical protein
MSYIPSTKKKKKKKKKISGVKMEKIGKTKKKKNQDDVGILNFTDTKCNNFIIHKPLILIVKERGGGEGSETYNNY